MLLMSFFDRCLASYWLLPVFLVAHLACACISGSAFAASPEAIVKPHACCEDDHHDEHHDAANEEHHEPADGSQKPYDCPHCSGNGQITGTTERNQVAHPELSVIPWAILSPHAASILPCDLSLRNRVLSPWLTDPSPPPEILQVTCTLQI